MQYPIMERSHTINGVPGKMGTIHKPQEVRGRLVHLNQVWRSQGRPVEGYGTKGEMFVEIRFDDQCKNGHQSVGITADVYTTESRRRRDIAAGGAMHEEIAAVFPELAPLIKWHFMSTDSPMHYVANTVYHASDRDHRGKLKGEPCAWELGLRFGDFPMTIKPGERFIKWLEAAFQSDAARPSFEVVEVPYTGEGSYSFSPKYTFKGFTDRWHECPFDTPQDAAEFLQALKWAPVEFVRTPTQYSEGKARDLDAARSCAVWPDATDEQLTLPREQLEALLLERLPGLMQEFRAAMEAAGFLWEPEA